MKYINVVYGYNKVVQSAVSREHSSAPTKLPAPKPYKRVNTVDIPQVVCRPTLGKPNHPCALRATRIAPLTPTCTQKLPNPRCRLQLRSPGRGDIRPGESVVDRQN